MPERGVVGLEVPLDLHLLEGRDVPVRLQLSVDLGLLFHEILRGDLLLEDEMDRDDSQSQIDQEKPSYQDKDYEVQDHEGVGHADNSIHDDRPALEGDGEEDHHEAREDVVEIAHAPVGIDQHLPTDIVLGFHLTDIQAVSVSRAKLVLFILDHDAGG